MHTSLGTSNTNCIHDNDKKSAIIKPERFGEIGNLYCDSSKILTTGWKPIIDLEKGISKTIDYFIAKNNV